MSLLEFSLFFHHSSKSSREGPKLVQTSSKAVLFTLAYQAIDPASPFDAEPVQYGRQRAEQRGVSFDGTPPPHTLRPAHDRGVTPD